MALNNADILCEDVNRFLQQMRAIDDKIIYELNIATPTSSFRQKIDPGLECKQLYEQLTNSYDSRGHLIQKCMKETAEELKVIQSNKPVNAMDDFKYMRNLKNAQSKLRELRNEVAIEEIIRERSLKAFNERCRQFYRIPQ